MVIILEEFSKQVPLELRKYSMGNNLPEKLIKKHVSLELICQNSNILWIFAPLIVLESGNERFIFKINLRLSNQGTVPDMWSISELQASAIILVRKT